MLLWKSSNISQIKRRNLQRKREMNPMMPRMKLKANQIRWRNVMQCIHENVLHSLLHMHCLFTGFSRFVQWKPTTSCTITIACFPLGPPTDLKNICFHFPFLHYQYLASMQDHNETTLHSGEGEGEGYVREALLSQILSEEGCFLVEMSQRFCNWS